MRKIGLVEPPSFLIISIYIYKRGKLSFRGVFCLVCCFILRNNLEYKYGTVLEKYCH